MEGLPAGLSAGGTRGAADALRGSLPERDSGKPRGQRLVCAGGLSERLLCGVAAAAFAGDRALRNVARLFHRACPLPSDSAPVPENVATAGVLHFFIGSLADWTSTLSPLLGREEAAALIQAQYTRLMPAMLVSYAGMVLMALAGAVTLLSGKTVLPRWMLAFHMLVLQLVLVLIPDLRQVFGAQISTWDFLC